jgi:hypothetical protein
MNKKAQAWGIDLMIAVVIFILGTTLFYVYIIDSKNTEKISKDLKNSGDIIMNNIFSEGFPSNWSLSTVTKIGILQQGKISEEKLEKFYLLSNSDYQKTKSLFETKYDFLFFLSENMSINSIAVESIGKPYTNKASILTENLIRVNRITVYKNKPVTATLYIWS